MMRTEIIKTFNMLKAWVLIISILGTMVFANIEVAQAEEIIHTHIWATKYDEDKHWEYCTVCAKIRNSAAHKCVDNWFLGNDTCLHKNYSIRICQCGYNYKYTKPHGTISDWINSANRLIHFVKCIDCGTWTKSERCSDNEGLISCKNPGKCNKCGFNYTKDSHYIKKDGTCRECGIKLIDISSADVQYASDYSKATVKFTITPRNSQLILPGTISAYTGTTNYKSVKWKHTKNNDGSVLYEYEHIFDPTKQIKTTVCVNNASNAFKVNDTYICSDNNLLQFTLWQDHKGPEVKEIKQVDQTLYNTWATIKELTISGEEELSSIVEISIIDKQTKDIIVDKAKTDVLNGKYSYKCTPPLEGPVEGRTYTLKVVDEIGNITEKDFVIYKTDCRAPLLRSAKEYTEWTKTKNLELELTDYGSGAPQSSIINQTSYKKTVEKNGKYFAQYSFAEDKYDVSEYSLYLRDGLGNATKETIKVGKVDNTKPTVVTIKSEKLIKKEETEVTSSTATPSTEAPSTSEEISTVEPKVLGAQLTVEANDINKNLNKEGSGVSGYAITTSKTEPKDEQWQKSNILTVDKKGVYYIWVKDLVGNIADVTVINVKEDMTVEINPEKIEFEKPEEGEFEEV